MLSPEQIEAAGNTVAAVYNDMEAAMLDHLVSSLVSAGPLDQKTATELALLAQSHGPELQRIIDSYRDQIADSVYETVEQTIKASDTDDMARIGNTATKALWPMQVTATVQGVARILARDNLKMVEGAKRAFLTASVEAVTNVNAGTMTSDQALHRAVRKLERDGIDIITYQNRKTGMVTVRNKVDVAVRRHVRTQIAQDGARMTLERMARGEVDLVEVSSHEDSRPSHREWQGRCYSLKGEVVIEGTRYRDFCSETHYGDVDGLLGANCRHSFGPYRHGAPRAYEPDPQPACGIPGEELYELEQKQRYYERQIRADKRELRGAQQAYDADPSLENTTALLKAKERLKNRQSAMHSFIKETNARAKPGTKALYRRPNREWAGDMPKIAKLNPSMRKVDDFISSKGVASQLKKAGISKTRAKAAISEAMAERGGTAKDFATLTRAEQQNLWSGILTRKKMTDREARRAKMKPVNEQLYSSQVNYVERHGGTVIRGGAECEKHLDSVDADAAQIGDLIFFREKPTTSEVLEEVFHFQQTKRGDYADAGTMTNVLREIDAQRYLLANAERYNIPKEETAQTRAALAYYEEELRKLEGGHNESH